MCLVETKLFFTLSVEAQAPMVEPELTEVGELHSLTDWQVSEASEEAELDEFCWVKRTQNGTRTARKKKGTKRQASKTKRQNTEGQTHT